jgi:hyperosmotically inducible periplasmic protein
MRNYVYALCLCTMSLGCSKDRPAESAYDAEPMESTAGDPTSASPSATIEGDASMSPGVLRADDAANPATAPRQNVAATTTSSPGQMKPSAGSTAGATATPAPAPGTQPDNTGINERDRADRALTPLDQGNNETDLRITQQIRQAVQGDDSLSFTAKNVKIITTGGKVTLRGPVNTAAERTTIENAARKIAGVAQVENQLEIKK